MSVECLEMSSVFFILTNKIGNFAGCMDFEVVIIMSDSKR